jgi:TraE protein.
MTGTVEFVQGRPSDDYLREIGQRVVSLATTYSPHTARRQFNELLVYYAPEAYAEASARWYSLAGRIEESQVSSVFYPEKFSVEEEVIEVFGDLKQFTGTTRLENTTRTYRIAYQVRDGRFSLLSFKEKGQPHGGAPMRITLAVGCSLLLAAGQCLAEDGVPAEVPPWWNSPVGRSTASSAPAP